MGVSLTLEAKDQRGWDLQGSARIMSFIESLAYPASYFHWTYTKINGDGTCWVRGHATDNNLHPCSTSHIRKNPCLYPKLYPSTYSEGTPGQEYQRLMCDISEFTFIDFNSVLNYESFLSNETHQLCVELQLNLNDFRNDVASSYAQVFLKHENTWAAVSGKVASKINGFFQYANIKPATKYESSKVTSLYLERLNYNLTATGDSGVQPVLQYGRCSDPGGKVEAKVIEIPSDVKG